MVGIKILKVIWRFFKAVAITLLLVTVIDLSLGLFLQENIQTELVRSDGNNNNLIVFLPGVLAPARGSIGDLINTWLKYGDVLLVDYGDGRFKDKDVTDKTCQAIKDCLQNERYNKLTFIGSSMGGILSYDVIKQLKEKGVKMPPISLVLIDSPTSNKDLVSPNDKLSLLSQVIYPGPLVDSLNIVGVMMSTPPDNVIEPATDKAYLAKSVEKAASYALSFYLDQVRYIVRHGRPSLSNLDGVIDNVVFVRCALENNVVQSVNAYKAWLSTAGNVKIRYMEVNSNHVGFIERRKTWENAFDNILGN